jgi:hypothetical protein
MDELRIAWRKPEIAFDVVVDSLGGTIATNSLARGELDQHRVVLRDAISRR